MLMKPDRVVEEGSYGGVSLSPEKAPKSRSSPEITTA